jgi:hypothetical protein
MSDVSAAADAVAPEAQEEAPEATPPKTIKDATKGVGAKAKTPGPAPWSKDLEELGLDPDTLTKVDEYMRSKIQPRTTQLEQRTSNYDKLFGGFEQHDGSTLDPDSAAEMASELLKSLASDPQAAVKEIMELMQLDPKAFLAVQEEMKDQIEEQTPQEPDEKQQWIEQQMQREKEAKEDAAWEDHLKSRESEIPGFNRELYTAMMAAVGPDPDTALEWYKKFHQEPAPAPEPSATLGEGHPTPPEDYNDSSIASAVKGFSSDMRAARNAR